MKQLICMLMLAGAVLISSQTASFAANIALPEVAGQSTVIKEEPPKPKKHKVKKRKVKKAKNKNRFGQKKVASATGLNQQVSAGWLFAQY